MLYNFNYQFENIDKTNQKKNRQIEKHLQGVPELFFCQVRKLKVMIFFIPQSYFKVSKDNK